ncbi:spexin prohormone 2 [Halichoeres trimaculatus]|uniref:spexin prohormone 2 n=1 Tax=Halichoeres trimaculatus TaxID=147232 RepID=UPI003D9E1C6D
MMNSHRTELNSAQSDWEHAGTDNSPSIGADPHVHIDPVGAPLWGGPPSAFSLPGAAFFPQQQGVHTATVDPLSFSLHCPYQYSQCLTDSDYPQASQYHLPTGPAPGSSDSSYVNLAPALWCSYDPALYSKMIPGDVPSSGLFVPPAVDHQQFLTGQTEFSPHYTQPMLYNVGGVEQEGQVHPCETGPVFHTLKPATLNRASIPTHGRPEDQFTSNMNMLATPEQLLLFEKAADILYEYSNQAPSVNPEAPPQGASGTRRPCRCTKSQCLKLYCECFASGLMCNSCECSNCLNNKEHEPLRQRAIKLRSSRNPVAFRTKVVGWRSGEVKGWHQKGCSCKRSGCLKNYCECYEANVMCTSSCKCVSCRNFDERSEMEKTKVAIKDKSRSRPPSDMALDLVRAVCGHLLTHATKAERETQSLAAAEQKILEEFGQCLKQMFK